MALRRIQDLSSYNLSAIKDIFIPVAALTGVSSYRVLKIEASQITNAVFDRINQESLETVFVKAPSANIINISAISIYTDSIASSSISGTNITIDNTTSIVLSSTSISANNLTVNNTTSINITGSNLTFTSGQFNYLSSASLTSTNANINNITSVNAGLSTAFVGTISATQITAISARFNGFAPVAKFVATINHTGSLNTVEYVISHPFNGVQIMTQLTRIDTDEYGLTTAQIVFADIVNADNSISKVRILEPNSGVFQLTLMS